MNKIREAFETVKADDKLKNSAMEAVRNRIMEENRKSCGRKSGGIFTGVSFGRKLAYGAAALCSIILAAGLFGFYSAYTSPSSYVSIDINPSMELALNRFNIVIDANAYNDDGEKVLEDMELCGISYTEAIERLLESEQMQDYFSYDYELVFTVISQNQQELIEGIESTAVYQKYGSCCFTADYEAREEALELGMSFGKYRAYQQLLVYYPDMTAEECRQLSMNQIKNMILEMGGEWEGGSQGNSQGCQQGDTQMNSHQGNSQGNSQGSSQGSSQGNSQGGSQSDQGGSQSGMQSGQQQGNGGSKGQQSGKGEGNGIKNHRNLTDA